jgi:hypothetical protein
MFQKGRFKGDGWVVGHMGKRALKTGKVGVKWALQPRGDAGNEWRTCTKATTLSVLISGKFKMVFREKPGGRERTVIFKKKGDYVIFGPGWQHKSEALKKTWFLTVRFPSIEGDCKVISEKKKRSRS